ncbi:hypothetical protein M601_014210 [Cellulophaga baltica 4]|nr:hypothetical protein M601_014210 [Cellulophaga baltica 4]
MKFKIVMIALIVIVSGIYFYNKSVEKRESDAKLREIIEIREEYRNQEKIETFSYLSDDQISLAAQKFVKKSLQSPSTAKFPALFKSSVKKLSPGYFMVSSFVDSQNTFGAMIRSNYEVKLRQTTDGKIELQDIKLY